MRDHMKQTFADSWMTRFAWGGEIRQTACSPVQGSMRRLTEPWGMMPLQAGFAVPVHGV